MTSDRAVLYGNFPFSVLVLSTEKWYSSYLKSCCFFQKISLRVKELKKFKVSSDSHIKTCQSLRGKAILKMPSTVFRRTYMLFLLALRWNLQGKGFSCIKTKPNSNFTINLAETLKKTAIHFCLFYESHFSSICTLEYVTVESIEINWLCKHRKKLRSIQASFSINSCSQSSKTQSSLSIVKVII